MKIKDTKLPPKNVLLDQLEQLGDDEVFTGLELSIKFKIPANSIRRLGAKMPMNVVRLGTINYYGSIKAIKSFKAHHGLSQL